MLSGITLGRPGGPYGVPVIKPRSVHIGQLFTLCTIIFSLAYFSKGLRFSRWIYAAINVMFFYLFILSLPSSFQQAWRHFPGILGHLYSDHVIHAAELGSACKVYALIPVLFLQQILSINSWKIFHCVYIAHFLYPVIS